VTSLPVSIGPNQSIKILNADGSISSLASIGAHLGTAFTIPSDAVDQHRFDSDPEPDPNRTFHLMPIRIRIEHQVVLCWKIIFFVDLYSQQCQSALFYISR
jgi:hypothetical protein